MNLPLRSLGKTGIKVSTIGLGTVKIGRNQKVKYNPFELPSDKDVVALLETALECGINLIDTAPAYGIAEERLGKFLPSYPDRFVICTKVGENFTNGQSTYDFSRAAVKSSVQRSLKRLGSPIDCVLLHCASNDLENIRDTPALEVLTHFKETGEIRSIGVSTMTIKGGMFAAPLVDVLMVSYNAAYSRELPVIEAAATLGRGVLIKKGLCSGNLDQLAGGDPVERCIRSALSISGVSSLIVGTITPDHLKKNSTIAARIENERSGYGNPG